MMRSSKEWKKRRAVLATGMDIFCTVFGCAAVSAAEEKKIDWEIHGFASIGYIKSDGYDYLAESRDGSFDFAEAGLNIGFGLTRDLRLGFQFFTRELGPLGNYDPEVDWLFLDYSPREEINLRLGRIKMPYGMYNETRNVDMARTAVLLPQGVYNERMRDYFVSLNGIGLYGEAAMGQGGRVAYQVYYGVNDLETDGSVAQLVADSGVMSLADAHNDGSYGVGLVWQTPLQGLRFGITQNYWEWTFDLNVAQHLVDMGAPPTASMTTDDLEARVISAEYSKGRLTLAAERSTQAGMFESEFYPHQWDLDGWYALGSYRISEKFEVGTYYSVYNYHNHDGVPRPEWAEYQNDLALSMRIDFTRNWILKVEAHDVDGTASLLATEVAAGDSDRKWRYYTGKVSFFF